jgi:anti-sigma factor RsiW
MSCLQVQEMFSAYLDGAINGREMQAVSTHLEQCEGCKTEFEAWRGVQQMLGSVGQLKAPDDLGLRLRLAISRENSLRQGHWWDVITMRWENLLRPALLQASAGFAGTIVLVGSLAMLIGVVAAPQAVMANDEPLGALTSPHYLYSAAHLQPVVTPEDSTIVIEADVNAAGQVYDYHILSGPTDPSTVSQVRDQLMVQVYEPARAFGEPVKGRVLITFSGMSVHS